MTKLQKVEIPEGSRRPKIITDGVSDAVISEILAFIAACPGIIIATINEIASQVSFITRSFTKKQGVSFAETRDAL